MTPAWTIALRFLKEGRLQTALIVVGAAVGVAVMVFLSSLITAVQGNLIDKTLGTQAHIVVKQPDEAARPLYEPGKTELLLRSIQQPPQRLRPILNAKTVLEQTISTPEVRAASPVAIGAGFAIRGEALRAVAITGVEPDTYRSIIDLRERLTKGTYRAGGSDALIGTDLAGQLGLSVGDKLRLSTSAERSTILNIAGIFDLENKDANERWVVVGLAVAQSLLDIPGGVTEVVAVVDDVFSAQEVAARVARRTGLSAESWMDRNAQLLVALSSQDSSSKTIQFFVVLAVALGIASVLFVSVVQKSREIGILKAFGTSTRTVLQVFLIQGLVVGFVGSALGSALGTGLALVFRRAVVGPDGRPTLPIEVTPELLLGASAVAVASSVLAGYLPARRAARLDPAVVIRYG
jgi:lipoprotein-releasing system permease protein